MKQVAVLLATLASALSLPAFAGPNWLIIHDSRKDTLLQDEHCARLDHAAPWHRQAAAEKHKSMLSSNKQGGIHS
jgi:hypothetical protein